MEKYQKLTEEGYRFEMGHYLSEGWEIFKKAAGSFIGFTIIYFIISMMISFIPFVNFFASFIQYALVAGIFIFCRQLLTGRQDFGNFFEGFKKFDQIALYLLVLLVFFIPFLVLFFTMLFPVEILPDLMQGTADPEDISYAISSKFEGNIALISLLYLVLIVGAMYLLVSYVFVLPLIVDSQMSFWNAMETSRKVVAKNFFSMLGMLILLGLMAGFGTVLTCGLGLLVVVPYLHTVIFSAYDNIFNPHATEVIDQVDAFGTTHNDINTESEDDTLS